MPQTLKELVLLRHAHAQQPTMLQHDIDRPLSARGREEARGAGEWLSRLDPPDAVLCSSARRARETWQQVEEVGDGLPVANYEASIYEASTGELLALIENTVAADPDIHRLWLVGHNPGLEQLLAFLDDGSGQPFSGMPTAGIAVLKFHAGCPLTQPGSACMADLHGP